MKQSELAVSQDKVNSSARLNPLPLNYPTLGGPSTANVTNLEESFSLQIEFQSVNKPISISSTAQWQFLKQGVAFCQFPGATVANA